MSQRKIFRGRQAAGSLLTFHGVAATGLVAALFAVAACAPAAENAPAPEQTAASAQSTAPAPQPSAPAQPAAPAPKTAPAPAPAPAAAPAPARAKSPTTANLPGGTEFEVMLVNEVASDIAQAGEPVEGRVTSSVQVNGRTVIPAGSRVEGVIHEVKPAKRFGGQAMVSVAWTGVLLADGGSLAIEGGLLAEAKGTTKKDTAIIAGSAAGGAILGKVLGGDSKDAAVGAAVGGGIGTAVASKRGDEAILPAETAGMVKTLASADLRVR